MIFAASQAEALATLGIPGLVVVIFVLAGVIVFLYKQLSAAQSRTDAIQEQRIVDAKETRDKITEPLDKQAELSGKIYELLVTTLSNKRGR